MSALTVRLPNSLHTKIRELVKAEGLSVNQFMVTAAAEKVEYQFFVKLIQFIASLISSSQQLRCRMRRTSQTPRSRQRHRLPIHIVRNLQRWALQVESLGIQEVRKISGYHDESLRGGRSGQRSIRLSKSYRAFYTEIEGDEVNLIQVEEINKHDY